MQPFEILHICDHVLCEVSEETKSIFSEKTYVEDARTDAIQGNCKWYFFGFKPQKQPYSSGIFKTKFVSKKINYISSWNVQNHAEFQMAVDAI